MIILSVQLAEIKKIRLGTILCENSRVLRKIQSNVFLLPDILSLVFQLYYHV